MIEFQIQLEDKVSAPASSATSALDGLSKGLTAMIDPATAALAIGAALAAGIVALGAAIYEGAGIALEAVDAYEDMVTQFDALTGSGAAAVAMLDDLSAATPNTRAELADWADTLAAAGETDLGKLQNSLLAISSAEALMGSHGKQAATQVTALLARVSEAEATTGQLKMADKQLVQLAKTGVNVSDVAREMGMSAATLRNQLKSGTADAAAFGGALKTALITKGAEALAGNMTDIPVLIAKAKEAFTQLFEGVNVKPFTDALSTLVQTLDGSSASGKMLKSMITQLFDGVFLLASIALPMAHLLLLKLIIDGLLMYNAVKPLIGLFGDFNLTAGDMESIVTVLEYGFLGLAVVVGILALALGAVVLAGAMLVGLTLVTLAAILSPVILLVWLLSKAADGLVASFGGNAKKAVDALITGLVSGLGGGTGLVTQAVYALAEQAISAFKKKFQSHSPSQVMIEMGGFLGEGLAQGIGGSTGEVGAASANLGQAAMSAVPPAAAAAAPSGGKGAAGVVVNVEAGAITVGGGGSALELTEHAVALLFERVALSQGLGRAPA